MTSPPVQAFALFFDDLRQEVGNKLSFMGQLLGTAFLMEGGPSPKLDRLVIVVHARWPLTFQPHELTIRVSIADQIVIEQKTEPPRDLEIPTQPSEFAGQSLQAVIMLRDHPIIIGDEVKIWLRVDGVDIPAGRLLFERPPPD